MRHSERNTQLINTPDDWQAVIGDIRHAAWASAQRRRVDVTGAVFARRYANAVIPPGTDMVFTHKVSREDRAVVGTLTERRHQPTIALDGFAGRIAVGKRLCCPPRPAGAEGGIFTVYLQASTVQGSAGETLDPQHAVYLPLAAEAFNSGAVNLLPLSALGSLKLFNPNEIA